MASKTQIGAVRSATKEDVVTSLSVAVSIVTSPRKLRESHHRVLRLIAFGLRPSEVSARTGYSVTRIAQICAAPASQDNIVRLRREQELSMLDDSSEEFDIDRQTLRLAKSQRLDRLIQADESNELLPIKDYNAIIADVEDRYGTPRKSTNVSVYANMADTMEAAIARSEAVTIEGEVK